MPSEDITFCSNHDCPDLKCDRNPKHIKQVWRNHSEADFEDTRYCRRSGHQDAQKEKK